MDFAWRVFFVLVKAAICIHAHDIIHRDLEPENILFMDNTPIEKVENEKTRKRGTQGDRKRGSGG